MLSAFDARAGTVIMRCRKALFIRLLPLAVGLRGAHFNLMLSMFVESVDAGLPDPSINGGWCAAAANPPDALTIDGYRHPSFDTDEPARAHGERLSQHLVVGDLAAIACRLAGSGGSQRGAACLGLKRLRCCKCGRWSYAYA